MTDMHETRDWRDETFPDEEHEHVAERDNMLMTVAAVGAVGVGALVFEAALLPGVALGVAAIAAPAALRRIGSAMRPMFRSVVRGAYKVGQKTREIAEEARETVEDVVAEVDAETPTSNAKAESKRAKTKA